MAGGDTPVDGRSPLAPVQRLLDSLPGSTAAPELTTALRFSDQVLDRFAQRSPIDVTRGLTAQISLRPGRSFEVAAMREHGPEGAHREHREQGEGVHVMRHGRMTLLGTDRAEGSASAEGGVAEARRAGVSATSVRKEDLGLFEKIFLAHFEGGIPLGELLEKGQFKFLPKTEKAWSEFFKAFAAFTLLKTGNIGDVQALVFRGLITPEGKLTPEAKALLSQAKAVLVSDMSFADGTTDKFARLAVMSEPMLQVLSKLAPGDVVTQSVFGEMVGGEMVGAEMAKATAGPEFQYLSVSHKIVNPEAAKAFPSAATEAYQSPTMMREAAIRGGVREVTQGIALAAKTERIIAERLDIDLKPARGEVGMDRRGGEATGSSMAGLLGKKKKRAGLSGGAADDADGSPVFVPWYQHVFQRKKFKGKPRWWVPLIYFAATSAAAFALLYVFRYWIIK